MATFDRMARGARGPSASVFLAISLLGGLALAQAAPEPAPAKPADTKPADAKPADAKPADAKPADAPKDVAADAPKDAAKGAVATTTQVDAAADPKAEWAERDRRIYETNTLAGGVGLLRTQHAQSGAPGQFRLSFIVDYFSAGFLCTDAYPCRNPKGGAALTNDSLEHIGGTLSAGFSLLRVGGGTLEAYASLIAQSNSSDANKPGLLQVLGDSNLGLRLDGPLGRALHLGMLAELQLVNGTGSVGLDGGGTGARLGPLFTVDLRELESPAPIRFSANVLYSFDNHGDVVAGTEAARGTSITRVERFGLGINRLDHVDIHIGGEVLGAQGRVRPFAEYVVYVPTSRKDYFCHPTNPSSDSCLAYNKIAPSKLTIGGRFFPWKQQGISLLTALDIGLTGTKDFIEEVPPTAPWTLFLGAAFATDTAERPPVVRTETIEAKSHTAGKLKGLVHEQGKEQGIAQAIVAWENHPELTSLATSAEGRFITHELPEGEYKFKITADGYKDGACAGVLEKTPHDVDVDCALEALPKVGTVFGTVRDGATQSPIGGITVTLIDATGKKVTAVASPEGAYKFEGIEPGAVTVSADPDGFLSTSVPSELKPRGQASVDVPLRRRPDKSLVTVGKKEITIKEQVQFAVDSSAILPASFALLQEVSDALIHNPQLKRVEVQGHTDNTGSAEHNRTLSEQRAGAVRAWLVAHGVPGDRLVAKGFGPDRPIAPNVTNANRAKNRRVQFIILDQDGTVPAAPKAAATTKAPPPPPPPPAKPDIKLPAGFPTTY